MKKNLFRTLIYLTFCFQNTQQILFEFDLNKEPSPERTIVEHQHTFGQGSSHQQPLEGSRSPSLERGEAAPLINLHSSSPSSSSSTRRKGQPSTTPLNQSLNKDEVAERARELGREATEKAGVYKPSKAYWKVYKNAFARHMRKNGFNRRLRKNLPNEEVKKLREKGKIRSKQIREPIQIRRQENKMTVKDAEYYAKARVRSWNSLQSRKQKKQ